MSGQSSSLRAVLYALSANFGIFLAKAVAAGVTGSTSMLAEAIHSLADCGNQGLLLRGMREARRAPTRDHPLGYGMVVYFWAFLVSVLLFTVGGAFSIYEGAHKLLTPEPIKETRYQDRTARPGVTYVYAIVAVDRATPPNRSAESNRVQETARYRIVQQSFALLLKFRDLAVGQLHRTLLLLLKSLAFGD